MTNVLRRTAAVAVAVAAALVGGTAAGCKKDDRGAPPPGPAVAKPGGAAATLPTTLPAAPGPAESDVVGTWRVTSVVPDDLPGPAGPVAAPAIPGDVADALRSAETTLRPDHTYATRTADGGEVTGRWKLEGAELTLTPTAATGRMPPATTMLYKDAALVERPWTNVKVSYGRSASS
ncbi:MAG TPA: hypothetical protein VF796_18480, partial [Humisphaera sp.]